MAAINGVIWVFITLVGFVLLRRPANPIAFRKAPTLQNRDLAGRVGRCLIFFGIFWAMSLPIKEEGAMPKRFLNAMVNWDGEEKPHS